MAAALILGAFVAVRAVEVIGEIENGYDYYEYESDWLWGDGLFPQMPFGRATGIVVEKWVNDFTEAQMVRIEIEGEYEGYTFTTHMDFVVDDLTFIRGEIEVGSEVVGFFNQNVPVIMIYPPQHRAYALAVNEELPRLHLGRLDADLVCEGLGFHLAITEDTVITTQGGQEWLGGYEALAGRAVLVEYEVSHRNIPETVFATRVIVLYERAVHPILEIDWDELGGWDYFPDYFLPEYPAQYFVEVYPWELSPVLINGEPVMGATLQYVGEDAIWPTHVSLRPVADHLGETLTWDDATRTATMTSPLGTIAITIGSDDAVIIGSRTYVPIRFFREAYGFNNAFFHAGNVFIDDNDVME
jgi:hypothetical protein